MMPDDCNGTGTNQCLCLPKAELKTKNSTLPFCWVFGFQLDKLEKHLITLAVVAFVLNNQKFSQRLLWVSKFDFKLEWEYDFRYYRMLLSFLRFRQKVPLTALFLILIENKGIMPTISLRNPAVDFHKWTIWAGTGPPLANFTKMAINYFILSFLFLKRKFGFLKAGNRSTIF